MSQPAEYAAAHAVHLHPLAHRLGLAGLVPFVLSAALAWLVSGPEHEFVLRAMAGYAAVIVSFLGAIHWGLGMRGAVHSRAPYAWGVTPALLASVALMMSDSAGLVIQGLLIIACYLVDRRLYPRHGMASWLTLRFRLTVVAALGCFIAAASP